MTVVFVFVFIVMASAVCAPFVWIARKGSRAERQIDDDLNQ